MSVNPIGFNSLIVSRLSSFDGMLESANLVIQLRDWTRYCYGSVSPGFNNLAEVFSTGQSYVSALNFAQNTKDLFKEGVVYELGSLNRVSRLGTQVKKVQKVAVALLSYRTTLNFLRVHEVISLSKEAMQRWDGVALALTLFTVGHWAYTEAAKLYTGKVTGQMIVSKDGEVKIKNMTRMHKIATLLNTFSACLLFFSVAGGFAMMGPFWVLFFSTVRLFLSMAAYYTDKLA